MNGVTTAAAAAAAAAALTLDKYRVIIGIGENAPPYNGKLCTDRDANEFDDELYA
jgi:hypothetical protein